MQDVADIFHTVLEKTGFTCRYSRAGKIVHYLQIPWDYPGYDSHVMDVLAVLLMDLMEVSSLEEIQKHDRLRRQLIFGEVEGELTDDYILFKAIEDTLAKHPPLETEYKDVCGERPWVQQFENPLKRIGENTKLLRQLDDKEAAENALKEN